ncbi:MAG TPA: carboxypeptidase-like regulatory domain-containing protein [Gemmatimonadales bacterium]|jgi:hypothetical protein
MALSHPLRQATRYAALGAALALAACGPRARTSVSDADSTASSAEPSGPFGSGTITGTVRFVGPVPENQAIDMRAAPACRAIYHSQPRQLSVIVNPNGTLANVFVYVKRGLPQDSHYAPVADTVRLAVRGCQYHPRIVGLRVGQALAIRNDDVVSHQIDAPGVTTRPFTIPLDAGRTGEHVFRGTEVMVPLQGAYYRWMRAYIGVLAHPFFDITGTSGHFTIPRLPPGTYTVEAWHEAYGRRTTTVTVQDSTTQRVTFSYSITARETSD